MDLYNFYRGIENVIDTLNKDRHDLTLKDSLIMCDPFFNIDFYDEKELSRQIGGADKDKDASTKTAESKAEATQKQADAEREESASEDAQAISEEDISAASADMDKEVDEMGPIKNLIKVATKVVVIFAIIICLPIVPWILISYYSLKKLHGLYLAYIQTY